MEQRHVQDWPAAQVAGNSRQPLKWHRLPLMLVAELSAPAMTWPTPRGGSGVGLGGQGERTPEMSRQAAVQKQPGGVASVGTAGPSNCSPEHGEVNAPSVPTRPAARAGTQTGSLWAQPGRCTGLREMSASWAWCTDGRQHQLIALVNKCVVPPFHLARLCVLATPWLCSVQRQQSCGNSREMGV